MVLDPARVVSRLRELQRADRRRERRPARGVDGHLGDGADVARGTARGAPARAGARRGGERLVDAPRRLATEPS